MIFVESRSWIPWIPEDNYLYGFAKVLLVYPIIMRILMWYYSVTKMFVPVMYGEKVRNDDKLKCVIFSHGLGGFRRMYSNIFCDLASRGFLVVALEHRDQSACHTYYYQSEVNAKKNIKTPIDHKSIGLHKHHYDDRNNQVNYRAEECSRILDMIINLNNGILPTNIIEKVPTTFNIRFKLDDLVGKIDTDNITMAGHSYGGATALLALSKRDEFKQGILLDPWMFPVKGEDLPEKVKQPLLFINTQTFHVVPNAKAMHKYMEGENREMYTLLHTTHEYHSDSALLLGPWLNLFMKKLDPLMALNINNALMAKFLNKYAKFPVDLREDERILKEQEANYESGLTKPWA